MTRTDCLRFALLASTALSAVPALAGDRLPSGASVAHGNVGISTPAANAMAIRQSSDTAIVNWRGFSIGEGARVDIHQPSSSSAMLNRVTGSTPSSIAGQLNANGQVYLINPNGIAITSTGTVRTGAFVASTLATTDEDFIAGRRNFRGNGRSATVSNEGSIEVGPGGYAALLGGKVRNSGQITARLGRIGLGAGEQATLDLSGDGFLAVAVPSDPSPGDDDPLITHSGRLSADGGRVEIKAATARQMARQVINLSGVVEARSVSGRSGAIVLGGGGGGRVRVSGRLDASAAPARPEPISSITPPPPRSAGGSITVSGDAVELAGATLDASGPGGGGSVRVGGDYQGKGVLQRARTTSVDATTLIAADALDAGDGGRVIVWSDEHTTYEGSIRARGGPDGGDGGFAEVSGKDRLWFAGAADLSAPAGSVGTLLVDPTDISIVEVPDPDSNDIAADTVETILSDVNFTVSTASDDAEAGNISVDAPLTWTTTNTLTLDADNDIAINAAIAAPDGGLTLSAGGTITADGSIDIGTFILSDGDWTQLAATLPAFSAADFRIEDGEVGDASFLRALGGDGTAAAPWLIADAFGLQGIGSAAAAGLTLPDLADSYALANDIDATGTAGWNDVEGAEGFDPIGALLDLPFTGSLDGQGFDIAGLFIDRPSTEGVGLFAHVSGGVQNVDLADVDITGGTPTGGLAGLNEGVIDLVSVTGTVVGNGADQGDLTAFAGGIAGVNAGTISRSSSAATVTLNGLAGNEIYAGGIAGNSSGAITDSIASGDVTANGEADDGLAGTSGAGGLVGQVVAGGTLTRVAASGDVVVTGVEPLAIVGGLVGNNAGSILQGYAEGAVPLSGGAINIGGLVGLNSGPIDQSYATGLVAGGDDILNGGLVGVGADGLVTASFWDTDSTGQDESAGGGTGLTTADFQNPDAFLPQASAAGWNFETTWAPSSEGFYPELYTLSPVVRVDVDDQTRQYGLDNPPLTSTNFGGPAAFVFGPPGDTLDTDALLTTTADADSGVDSYVITTSSDEATSGGGIVYRLITTDGALVVTPAPLIVIADDQAKQYGSTFVFDGTEFSTDPAQLFNDDVVTSATIASPAAPGTADAGTYLDGITIANAQGTGLENYTISYESGDFVVNTAPLTITANDQQKTYGATFAFNGTEFTTDPAQLFNDDVVTAAALSSPATAATANAGTYDISIANLLGQGLQNYAITLVEGDFVVDPAMLRITANDQSKTYGSAFPFSGTEFTASGLRNDDTVDAVTLTSRGAPATATVAGGPYPIRASDARGNGLSNYSISFTPGALAVRPKALTITADNQAKSVGQQFIFDGTEFSSEGLVNGDRITSVILGSAGAPASAPASNIPYAIDVSDAQGDVSNYEITFEPGNLFVVPQDLTFDAGLRLPFATSLANPADVIQIADTQGGFAPAGGGPTLGTGEPSTATAAREQARETLSFLESLSTGLDERIATCGTVPADTEIFLGCVEDTLSDYARSLDSRILDLPEPLRQVSAVIRQSASQIEGVRADAARRIAAATSDAEIEAIRRDAVRQASAAVESAVAEIRRAIELIRAEDDPQLASLQSQQGAAITAALQSVEDGLTQAVGL